MAHTFEAAHQLLKAATELARIPAEPELRFNCLETVRPPAHYICARLDRTAAGASAAGEGHAQLAQSVQKELVLGYKAVVRDALAADELTDPLNDLLGNAMHRTAADLSCALLRTYEFYTDAPPKAWYELNQLYRLADELGIATNAYADEQSRGGGMLTLADVYLRIALLAVAKPNQLRQKDLSAVFNALDQWTPRITHRRAGRRHDVRRRSRRRFAAELSRTRQPHRRALRGIRTDVLVYELEAYLAEMASDVPVPDYIGLDLLRHLAHAWGMMKKRSFRRSRSSGTMKICVGLRTLHYYISGGVEFADQLGTTEALLRREINPFIAGTGRAPRQPARATSGTTRSTCAARDSGESRISSDPNRILLNDAPAAARADAVEASYPCYDSRDPRYESVRILRALDHRRCRPNCRPASCWRFANAMTRAGASRCRAGFGTATRKR